MRVNVLEGRKSGLSNRKWRISAEGTAELQATSASCFSLCEVCSDAGKFVVGWVGMHCCAAYQSLLGRVTHPNLLSFSIHAISKINADRRNDPGL